MFLMFYPSSSLLHRHALILHCWVVDLSSSVSTPVLKLKRFILPERYYLYIRSGLLAIANPFVVCLPVVRNVRAPYSGVETFDNIFPPFCTLAILWPPCKILRRSSQGNLSVGGIKRKRGNKIERWWTYQKPHLTSRYGYFISW